jgi:hypothetical protein
VHASKKYIFIAATVVASISLLLLLSGSVVLNSLRIPMADVVIAESTSGDGEFHAQVINRVGISMVGDSASVVVTDRANSGESTSGNEKVVEFKRPIVHNLYWIGDRTLVIEYDNHFVLFPNGVPPWHGVNFDFRGIEVPPS